MKYEGQVKIGTSFARYMNKNLLLNAVDMKHNFFKRLLKKSLSKRGNIQNDLLNITERNPITRVISLMGCDLPRILMGGSCF